MSAPLVDPCGPGDVIWAVQYLAELLEMNFKELVDDFEAHVTDDGEEVDGETDGETDSYTGAEMLPEAVTETPPEAATDSETDGETDGDEAPRGTVSEGKAKPRLGDWSDDQCPYWERKRVEVEDVDDYDAPRSYAFDTGNPYGVLEIDEEDDPDEHVDEEGGPYYPQEHDDPRRRVDEQDDPPENVQDEPQEHMRDEVDFKEHDDPDEHASAENGPRDDPHVDEKDNWMPRVRVTKPRSWRRTGRRQLKHKNRRLREKRRRRRCRHHRQRCGAGGLRRRAPIRGGANPGERQPKRSTAGQAPAAADEKKDTHTLNDEAWFMREDLINWSRFKPAERDERRNGGWLKVLASKAREQEMVRKQESRDKHKAIKGAQCSECKEKTDTEDNPILICEDCVSKGVPRLSALHHHCTKPRLDAVPDGNWFCDECRKKRGEVVPVQSTGVDGSGPTQQQQQPTGVGGPMESTQPQPQPMDVDGPTESIQKQQQPMERAPVATVAKISTATKRIGRTASKGKAEAGKAKAGSTVRKVRKRRVRKPARVVAKEYARILEDFLNSDEMAKFVEATRTKAAEKAKHFENTCPRAGKEPLHANTSIPLIAKLLARGVCDDHLDGIEILDGVFFKHAALDALERYFNWEYVFDPESIGVILGKTKVSIDGEEFVVESFDCGEYILSDGSVMQQRGVLENRTDGGVTLKAEQRRFIIHLVTTCVNMMAHVVPAVIEECTPSMVKDMMWNPVEARKRETNEERREELDQIINRVNTLRDLTLRIFTGAAVKDTLPASFWDVEGNAELREFAEEAVSLKKINFLDRLECVRNREVVAGKLFTGEIVTGGYSEAPKPDRVSGAWHAKLRSIIVQLTCVYRLGRSGNLLEAYYALSEAEIEVVMKGHRSHWSLNLDYGLPDLDRLASAQTTATDADLQGESSHALRLAVKRCRVFNPNIAPVTVVGCGIRDAEKYGSLQRDSLDSKFFSHARFGKKLVPPLMGNASCREPAKQAIKASGKLFDVARNGRAKATAEKGGGVGTAAKVRQQRVVLLDLTPEEREKVMDMFMAAIAKNSCGRLMDAIRKHDPGLVEWGKERLAKAELKSSCIRAGTTLLKSPTTAAPKTTCWETLSKRLSMGSRGWRAS
ncbi:unnamed protein product [Ectocarpus sp. 13 AM-2016]